MVLYALGLATAMLVSVAASQNVTTNLGPVMDPGCDVKKLANIVPTNVVALNYGSSGESLVNVTLHLETPGVLLEQIEDISDVVCSNETVVVTFNSSTAFNAAVAEWSASDSLILFTNHLGNCDVEEERGVFLASSITSDNSTLAITALSEKKDVASTASKAAIQFSNVPIQVSDPTTAAADKRSIAISTNGVEIAGNLSLPEDTTLFSAEPYVTITADEAYLGASVTFSGYLEYTILTLKLNELYFDIDTTMAADSPDALSFSLINIPGIILVGPALVFGVGVDLYAGGAVNITTHLGFEMTDGNVHIDFVDESETSVSGWTPSHTATVNVTEEIEVNITPYVDITVEMALKLLDGLVDLSGGVKAEPKFINDFVLSGSQDESGSTDSGAACSNGLAINSTFEFSVIGFVTEWWSTTLYSVDVPVADECYSWA